MHRTRIQLEVSFKDLWQICKVTLCIACSRKFIRLALLEPENPIPMATWSAPRPHTTVIRLHTMQIPHSMYAHLPVCGHDTKPYTQYAARAKPPPWIQNTHEKVNEVPHISLSHDFPWVGVTLGVSARIWIKNEWHSNAGWGHALSVDQVKNECMPNAVWVSCAGHWSIEEPMQVKTLLGSCAKD